MGAGEEPKAMTAEDIWPPRERWVGIWLLVVCALVLAMILVGGATRLTDSGLSITEWNFMKHLVPPLTAEGWAEEFALYQRTTEYQLQNRGMSLAEFQSIYWWEWGHRFLGQVIGFAFLLPALFFFFTGRLRGRFRVTLLLFALGALQGAIGWWMVASGLADRVTVSPYRLAVHLLLALAIYAGALWVALDLIRGRARPHDAGAGALGFTLLVFLTIAAGAFVAGNRAGMIYNTFPLMDGRLIPDPYVDPALGAWRSLFEGFAAVQFNHRVMAIATSVAAFALWLRHRTAVVAAVPLVALLQLALGIATLLLVVPIPLAAAHQAGAVALLTAAVAAAHALARKRADALA
jgi:cytochrome c oxidase assembly protein subunit 15